MSIRIKYKFARQIMAITVIGMLSLGSLFANQVAKSQSNPSNCSATGVGLSLSVYRSNGITPIGSATVTAGESIVYKATLSHLGTPNCNYEGGTLSITKPDGIVINVTGPGVPLISFGNPHTATAVNYVVNASDVGGDNDLDATAIYTGGTSYMGANNVSPISASIAVASNFDVVRPFIMTQIHDTNHNDITGQTAIVGTIIYDKVILTPTSTNNLIATGTVDFMLYNNATCTGTPVNTQNNVPLINGQAESATTTAALYSLSYRVHYDGNNDYPAMTADCEWLLVQQAATTASSEIHTANHANVTDGSVVVNTPIHNNVTVTPYSATTSTPPMATGTVDIRVFNNGTCIGNPALYQHNVPLVNGVAESNTIPAAIWWVSYQARYNGDSNYPATTADCEVVNVTRPTDRQGALVTTQVHNPAHVDITGTTVALGTVIHDRVMVTSTSTIPTGSVTFNFFNNDTCYGDPLSVQNDIALINGTAESATRTPAAGQYSYRAVYNGDNTFLHLAGACEPVTVGGEAAEPPTHLSLELVTQIHNASHVNITNGSVVSGTPIHDKVILTPHSNTTTTPPMATGTVDFRVYNNDTCVGNPGITQANVPLVNGIADSNTIPAAIWWISYSVHYNGDANYPAATADCEVVNVTYPVDRQTPTVTTQVHNSEHTDITSDVVALGTVIHDQVMVTSTSTMPTGTVTFKFFDNQSCSGSALSIQNDVPLINGMAESSLRTPGLGQYSYLAVYNGNASYNAQAAECEPISVMVLSVEPPTIQPPVIQQQSRLKGLLQALEVMTLNIQRR